MSDCGCNCGCTPNWSEMDETQKLARIEQVLDAQVRPMLKSDGGGMTVSSLEGDVLTIQYSGACGGCPHALTGTRMFIMRQLAQALGVELDVQVVKPD